MFQEDSEGEQVDGAKFILDKDSNFITPDGKLIALPKGAIIYSFCLNIDVKNSGNGDFPNGALYGFNINNTKYTPNYSFSSGGHKFLGYYSHEKKESYLDKTIQTSGKKTISFINFTNSPVEGSTIEYYDISFDFKTTTNNEFVVLDYFNKMSSGVLVDKTENYICGSSAFITNPNNKLIKPISSKDRYEAKVFYDETTKKWKVDVKLDKKLAKNINVKQTSEVFEKQMSELATQKVNELGGLDNNRTKPVFETTDDGGEFLVKEMNGEQWLGTICDLGSNVWESAALPENYWNQDNEGFKDSTIHLPPTLSGVSDGAIGLVSDYPQLVKLGYDVATKEEVRNGIWTAVKNISPSSVYSLAENAVKDKISKYNFSDKPYLGHHEIGKDGVAVVSMVLGGSFITKGSDALENGTKEVGEEISEKAAKKVDDILDNYAKQQKEILEKIKKGELEVNSNYRKGNFGEMATDVDLSARGFKPLHTDRVTNLDATMKQGIDGVFEKNGQYFIVESKYSGTSKLKNTIDGPQMSDAWIKGSNRLNNSVGADVRKEIIDKGYKRILSQVAPDGKIIYKELDLDGKIISTINML
jgi:hypothetical protein